MANYEILCKWTLRLRLHEPVKQNKFAQILTELLHPDLRFEQIQASLFCNVNPDLDTLGTILLIRKVTS